LSELDKDRREKKCEYAVLVILLEAENELYNTGIVDVSYKYPKMYVVRPQFFIPIITLLRNAGMNSMKYKSELAMVKAQNVDVTKFEDQLNDFRNSFGRNYRLASEKFKIAIDSIDKSITQLQKTKENLLQLELGRFRLLLFWFAIAERRRAETHRLNYRFHRSVRKMSEPSRTRRVVSHPNPQAAFL